MDETERLIALFEYAMNLPLTNLYKEQHPIRLLFNKVLDLQERIKYLEKEDERQREYPTER